MAWLRLEAAVFQDGRLVRAGFWAKVVYLAALTYAKLHSHRGGRIPKADFTADVIAHHVGTLPEHHRCLEPALGALVKLGLLDDDVTHYTVTKWKTYQDDRTATERKQRQRAKAKESRDVTDVTTYGTGRDGPSEGPDRTGPPSGRAAAAAARPGASASAA